MRVDRAAEGVTDAAAEITGTQDQLHGQSVQQRRHIVFTNARLYALKPLAQIGQVSMLLDESNSLGVGAGRELSKSTIRKERCVPNGARTVA